MDDIVKIRGERQKKLMDSNRKGLDFLNGRDISELTNEELDALKEILGDNFLDPRNNEHQQIIKNRKAYQIWEDYLKDVNDRSQISHLDSEYGLDIHNINRYYYNISAIALDDTGNDPFLDKLRDSTVFIHDSRLIQIPHEIAKAVANPDESDMSDESMNIRGVIYWGSFAYDLKLHLTIDKREYENLRSTFCLYFALKMSQVELMDIDIFLDYQLEVTFDNNLAEFTRFLTLLIRSYDIIELEKSTLDKKQESIKETVRKDILSEKLIRSVNEWIQLRLLVSLQTSKLNSGLQEQNEVEYNEEGKRYLSNSQWVLVFHYGYSFLTGGLDPRLSSNLTDFARFIHLIGKKKPMLKPTSSEIYTKLQKAPNFKNDQYLIQDLVHIKDLFLKHGINGAAKLVENEIDITKKEKLNKD